jgi:hypothetical protein
MAVRSENSELAVSPEVLNERIKTHVEGNWLHRFEVDADKNILAAESYSYRWRILEPVFASLFYDRSVLVLDEASGIYPALLSRAGARVVSASSPNQRTCDLISEVTGYLETNVVRSKMVAFYENEPYVDMDHGGGHEFLLALGQVWPMFGAAGQDFDALVEACAFFVTDGIVLDWTNAEWATPPPPEHYDIEGLCDALRLKFDYVISYDDWLVVATGKLPTGDGPAPTVRASRPVRRRRPAAKDPQKAAYRQFLPRFRELVCRAIPPDGTAIVVSKGRCSTSRDERPGTSRRGRTATTRATTRLRAETQSSTWRTCGRAEVISSFSPSRPSGGSTTTRISACTSRAGTRP